MNQSAIAAERPADRRSPRSTAITVFPRACPSPWYRSASRTSSSPKRLSTMGFTLPDSMSSFSCMRSFLVVPADSTHILRLTKGERTSPATMRSMGPNARSVFPDAMTSVPVGQCTPAVGQRPIANEIEQQVVALAGARKVFASVINDGVRADRSDHLDAVRAVHASHVRSECSGDLHGKCSDTSGRAIDQHPLVWPKRAFVAQTLQRGGCRQGHRRGPSKVRLAGFGAS